MVRPIAMMPQQQQPRSFRDAARRGTRHSPSWGKTGALLPGKAVPRLPEDPPKMLQQRPSPLTQQSENAMRTPRARGGKRQALKTSDTPETGRRQPLAAKTNSSFTVHQVSCAVLPPASNARE